MSVNKKMENLQSRKKKLEERLYKAQCEENRKIGNIGWGCGMRGYKKISSLNISKSGKIREQLELVEDQIKELESKVS